MCIIPLWKWAVVGSHPVAPMTPLSSSGCPHVQRVQRRRTEALDVYLAFPA